MYKTTELFDLTHTLAGQFLAKLEYPWEALACIGNWIRMIGMELDKDEYTWDGKDIWIAKDAVIFPNNYIAGPCIIGHGTEVRPGAFVRGNALVGDHCVVGNSTELKNVILFDHVQVPHYNYVGDSILGFKSHMGAGSITSNVKSDKKNVVIRCGEEMIETGLKKVGAMVGDGAEIGCNSVLNPGTIIGRESQVYPTSCVRGTIPERHIWKEKNLVVAKREE